MECYYDSDITPTDIDLPPSAMPLPEHWNKSTLIRLASTTLFFLITSKPEHWSGLHSYPLHSHSWKQQPLFRTAIALEESLIEPLSHHAWLDFSSFTHDAIETYLPNTPIEGPLSALQWQAALHTLFTRSGFSNHPETAGYRKTFNDFIQSSTSPPQPIQKWMGEWRAYQQQYQWPLTLPAHGMLLLAPEDLPQAVPFEVYRSQPSARHPSISPSIPTPQRPHTLTPRALLDFNQCHFLGRAKHQQHLPTPPLSTEQELLSKRLPTYKKALQNFWTIHSLDELQHMDTDTLESILSLCLEDPGIPTLSPHLLQAEHDYLLEQLSLFLSQEKARPPFQIFKTQVFYETTIQETRIKFTIDRIDELSNGKKLGILYTTKSLPAKLTLLDHEAIPLAIATQAPELDAVAYGSLHATQLGWYGMGDIDTPFSRLQKFDAAEWEALKNEALHQLEKIIAPLSAPATPNPLNPQYCRHCHFSHLCRVHHVNR